MRDEATREVRDTIRCRDEPDPGFMRLAIALTLQGSGRTNPNPLVGAVVVSEGRIIGQGYHERLGQAHAERNALADCARRGADPRGATMYVTLEPCCHQGRQPPCAHALVEAGIARVVVGSRDPNPLVSGKGCAYLRERGIDVVEDFLRDECDAINPVFFHFITTGTPYVVAKWGMSADGKIACASGDARWVTGELARAHGHALRNRLAAIMVGRGTVDVDDPELTCRLEGGRDPIRVVCDSSVRLPCESRLVASAGEVPLIVACACGNDEQGRKRAEALRDRGVEVLDLPGADGRVDLGLLMSELGRRGIDSVLVEGGARLHASMLAEGLVNEVVCYLAPKIVGGSDAPGPVGGESPPVMADALPLGPAHVGMLGPDVRISWRIPARAPHAPRDCTDACVSDQPLGPVWERAKQDAEAHKRDRVGLGAYRSQERGGERGCSRG